MKSSLIITIFVSLVLFGMGAQAQKLKKSSELDFKNACSESSQFTADEQILFKDGTDLKVNLKDGELVFSDTLVKEEHLNMREYEIVGVNESICKGLIRENRLTESRYILVDLRKGSFEYIDSYPLISKDLKYLVTISQPEGDEYKGLKLFRLKKGKLILDFEDNDTRYYYLLSSGKWCDGELHIVRIDMHSRKRDYWMIIP